MAGRIAELIRIAKKARGSDVQTARKECSELVLALWKSRRIWPSGDPFRSTRKVLEVLKEPSHHGARTDNSKLDSSFDLYTKLAAVADSESQYLFNAALLDLDVSSERRFLADHRELLSKKRVEIIEAMIARIDALESGDYLPGLYSKLQGLNELERKLVVAAHIRDSMKQREEILRKFESPQEEDSV